jgi:hypothetical protein
MLVLLVALKRGPESVNSGGSCAVRLDSDIALELVFTVLPLY